MTEGTDNTPMMTPREMGDFYKKHFVVIVDDLHAADFMLLDIGRRGTKTALPGGYPGGDENFAFADYRLGFMDDLESASPEITEGLRAILDARPKMHPSDFLGDPFFFDCSGSMPDSMIREMEEEVRAFMGDFIPMEMAPSDIEDRMNSLLGSPFAREARAVRLEYAADYDMKRTIDTPRYFEQHDNGAPRSIKETRRAQGRGNKGHAMRGWKRK